MKTSFRHNISLQWFDQWSELKDFLDEVVQFDQLNFPTPWKIDQWQGLLSSGEREFSLGLLFDQDKLIGLILFLHDQADRFTHLVKVVTDPDYKRQGWASTLFQTFLDRDNCLFERIYLEVEVANIPARELYRRWGFQELRPLKDFYGPHRDGLGMLWLKEED